MIILEIVQAMKGRQPYTGYLARDFQCVIWHYHTGICLSEGTIHMAVGYIGHIAVPEEWEVFWCYKWLLPTPSHRGLVRYVVLQCRHYWGIHIRATVLSQDHFKALNGREIRRSKQCAVNPQLSTIDIHGTSANGSVGVWLFKARHVMGTGRKFRLRLTFEQGAGAFTTQQLTCHCCLNSG